jgi:hypothetical protein
MWCCSYIKSKHFLQILVKSNDFAKNTKNESTFFSLQTQSETKTNLRCAKCYICQRFIKGILQGYNLIDYLQKTSSNCNFLTDNMLIQLTKPSVWYYNDISDNIGHELKNKFNLSREDIKNIYRCIKNIKGLPSIEIINNKANEVIMMLL